MNMHDSPPSPGLSPRARRTWPRYRPRGHRLDGPACPPNVTAAPPPPPPPPAAAPTTTTTPRRAATARGGGGSTAPVLINYYSTELDFNALLLWCSFVTVNRGFARAHMCVCVCVCPLHPASMSGHALLLLLLLLPVVKEYNILIYAL